METIQQVLNSIIRNVLTALYQPFWAALLLAGVSMFAFLYAKEHDWKNDNFLPQMIMSFAVHQLFAGHFY